MAMFLIDKAGLLSMNVVCLQCLNRLLDKCAIFARGAVVVLILPISVIAPLIVQLPTVQP